MPNTESATIDQGALWELIKSMADPSDLLRTIFNTAADRAQRSVPLEISAGDHQTLVIAAGTVTINQHVARAEPAVP